MIKTKQIIVQKINVQNVKKQVFPYNPFSYTYHYNTKIYYFFKNNSIKHQNNNHYLWFHLSPENFKNTATDNQAVKSKYFIERQIIINRLICRYSFKDRQEVVKSQT